MVEMNKEVLNCPKCGSVEKLDSNYCSKCGRKLIVTKVKLTGYGYGINLVYRFITQKAFNMLKMKYPDDSNEIFFDVLDVMRADNELITEIFGENLIDNFTESYWIQSFEGIDEITLSLKSISNTLYPESSHPDSHDSYPVGTIMFDKIKDQKKQYSYVMVYKIGLGKEIDTSIDWDVSDVTIEDLEDDDVHYNNQLLYLGTNIEPVFLESDTYEAGEYSFEEFMVIRCTDLLESTFEELNKKAEYILEYR
jgi:hypothetical protein